MTIIEIVANKTVEYGWSYVGVKASNDKLGAKIKDGLALLRGAKPFNKYF